MWDKCLRQKYNCLYDFCLRMFHKNNGTNEVFPQGFISVTYLPMMYCQLHSLNIVTVAMGTQNFGFKKIPEVLWPYTMVSLTSSGNIAWMSYALEQPEMLREDIQKKKRYKEWKRYYWGERGSEKLLNFDEKPGRGGSQSNISLLHRTQLKGEF